MSSIENDPRFSKVLTDPRFLPMPMYEKKVKIDKRFNALFTSKDFGHRTLLDKRGRPIHDVSKRGKHVMEQFYQISSEESSSDDEDESADTDTEKASQRQRSKKKSSHEDKQDQSIPKPKDKARSDKKKTALKSKKSTWIDEEEEEDDDEERVHHQPTAKRLKKEEKLTKKRKSSGTFEEEVVSIGRSPKKSKAIGEVIEEQTDKKSAKKKRKYSDSDDESSGDEEEVSRDDDDEDEKITEDDSDEDEEDSSDESDDSSDEEELDEYTTEHDLVDTKIEHKWNELHRDAPAVVESTHRLAVCNMDWDFVKAQDLFILFKSFAGEGGSIHSVTIYPSEFGKERMAEEALLGPKEMRESLKNGESGGMKDKLKKKHRKNKPVDGLILKKMERKMIKAEREVLRNYQLNRLRYFYAVVDCSSVEVADNIYKECDGQEYQLSSVKLDLRFIPDNMTFDETPKESFTEEQGLVDYTPKRFNSTALSQAKVEVTWDETEFDRLQKRMHHVQHKELEDIVEENRYSDIIAPPESDSDLDDDGQPQWLRTVLEEGEDEEDISEEKKISLYRKVIMDKLVEEEEKEKRENEIDKEIEWQPGLKSAVESKLKKSEKAQGTLVDDYLEKKKEKKKKKRQQKKAELAKEEGGSDEGSEMDADEVPDIIDNSLKEIMESEGIDVNSLKKKKKQDKKKKVVEGDEDNSDVERERAELELLLMGDGDERSIAKPEKVRDGKLSRRQKKKQSLLANEKKKKDKDELTIDVNDQRFSAMFSNHHFHIDPSAPEFKKTQNMMKLVDEQIKRKPKKKVKDSNQNKTVSEDEDVDSRAVSKKLLESLKRKMKK